MDRPSKKLVSALIPSKGFANAKQRLAPLLSAGERGVLAEAMLRDVLSQVVLARGLETIFVVTGDTGVSEIASSLGAQAILEEEEGGETGAVHFALAQMKQRGIHTVLVIPADIPLVQSSDIESLIEHASGHDASTPFALLVPSHDRMGTNALLLSPPDVIRLRFGYDSFSYHLGEVAAQGVSLQVLENERIGLDIDEPKDLERFMQVVARARASTEFSRISCSCPPTGPSSRAPFGSEPQGRRQAEGHDHRAGVNAGEAYHKVLQMGSGKGLQDAHRFGRL